MFNQSYNFLGSKLKSHQIENNFCQIKIKVLSIEVKAYQIEIIVFQN